MNCRFERARIAPAPRRRVMVVDVNAFAAKPAALEYIDHMLARGLACSMIRREFYWMVTVLAYEPE